LWPLWPPRTPSLPNPAQWLRTNSRNPLRSDSRTSPPPANLNIPELNAISDGRSRDREAIVLNTSNQVKKLQQNRGAFYEISSGIVDFFSLDKNGLVIDV